MHAVFTRWKCILPVLFVPRGPYFSRKIGDYIPILCLFLAASQWLPERGMEGRSAGLGWLPESAGRERDSWVAVRPAMAVLSFRSGFLSRNVDAICREIGLPIVGIRT